MCLSKLIPKHNGDMIKVWLLFMIYDWICFLYDAFISQSEKDRKRICSSLLLCYFLLRSKWIRCTGPVETNTYLSFALLPDVHVWMHQDWLTLWECRWRSRTEIPRFVFVAIWTHTRPDSRARHPGYLKEKSHRVGTALLLPQPLRDRARLRLVTLWSRSG